jgi:N-acetylmuramoyl-L-alanine amidase
MAKKKLYLSASTQENNKGVAGYGTEEDNMFNLRDRTEYFIKNGGHGDKFDIFKNTNKDWTLTKIVTDSNKNNVDLHAAFHSNAGATSVRGCEVYHYYKNTTTGKKFAELWYSEISKVTPTADRGVHKDNVLYSNGLYELRETTAPAALCEHFFHTSTADVNFYKANVDLFAIGTARAIYKLFNYTFTIPKEAENLEDWETIIKKVSKWSDLWIVEIKKSMKETGYNWPGLIQKIKDLN